MREMLVVLAAAGTLAAGAVQAQSGADVLRAKECLGCHEFDKKKVGPAYKEVAEKYKGKKDAEGMLIGKLKEGKAHPKVTASEAELKAAIKHLLTTK